MNAIAPKNDAIYHNDGTPARMSIRYLGTKVCYTMDNGAFLMADLDELNEDERKICDAGGGYLPLSLPVAFGKIGRN